MRLATRSSDLIEQPGCYLWCTYSKTMWPSASFRLARPLTPKGTIMSISETLKARLSKDRPMTSITLRIPVDVVDSMKSIAPKRGFAGYQTLLKAYLSDGLRHDEAKYTSSSQTRLLEALKRHGIPQEVLDEATREIA